MKITTAKRAVLSLSIAAALLPAWPGSAPAAELSFGIAAFDGAVTDAAGDPLAQAGAHPATFSLAFDYNSSLNPDTGTVLPVEDVHLDLTDLPPGFLGGTAGLPQCTESQLANGTGASAVESTCEERSQVGLLRIRTSFLGDTVFESAARPVFNMVPPPGSPARFGINVAGALILLDTEPVPGGGDYVLRTTAVVPQALAILGNTLELWSVPWAESHDPQPLLLRPQKP